MILIIVLVSVFLFISCGEPTFCELTGISITASSNTAFSVSGTDEDLSLIEQGPGLILCYYIATDTDNFSNIDSKVISAFSSASSPTLIIGNSDGEIAEVSDISGTSESSYTLYAFLNGTSVPVSPVYSLNLSSYVSGTTLNASFTDGTVDKTNKTYSFSDGTNTYTLNFSDDSFAADKTIVILAAFTSGVGEFSNIYWSSLKRIGYFNYDD
ncbi:MAG: hypothetical protein K6F82_06135 [Sphaerochaetaceae bacterium]|nr:hypothetical protein [Sphaerochaetaceae bacterium]